MKFEARGRRVFALPEETPQGDGSTKVTMGFPVCTIHECIVNGELSAKAIAKIMNLHHEEFEK